MQLRRSGLRGVLVCGVLLRALHRHFAGVCADLRGAAEEGQTHRPPARTRRAGRRSPTQEGRGSRVRRWAPFSLTVNLGTDRRRASGLHQR